MRYFTADQCLKIDALINSLRALALCVDQIDCDCVRRNVDAAYAAHDLSPPELVFCSSPGDAICKIQTCAPPPLTNGLQDSVSLDELLTREPSLGDFIQLMRSAHSQCWPRLGEEVDLAFSQIEFMATDPHALHPLWSPLASRLERKLMCLGDLSYAVRETLEKLVSIKENEWLLSTQGSATLWGTFFSAAPLMALVSLGIAPRLPRECELGHSALASCCWLFSFERICFVCERPQVISHPALCIDSVPGQILLSWRDGFASSSSLNS